MKLPSLILSVLLFTFSASAADSESFGRALGCTFSPIYYQALLTKMNQSELLDLLEAVRAIDPSSAENLWFQLPPHMGERYSRMIEKGYNRTRPNSGLRSQTLEFYKNLFAEGLMRLAKASIESDYIDFVKITHPISRGGLPPDDNAFGVRIYLDPHTFDGDRPVQLIVFCL